VNPLEVEMGLAEAAPSLIATGPWTEMN